MEEVLEAIGSAVRAIKNEDYSNYNRFALINTLYLKQKGYIAGISLIISAIPKLKYIGFDLDLLSKDLAVIYNLVNDRKTQDLKKVLAQVFKLIRSYLNDEDYEQLKIENCKQLYKIGMTASRAAEIMSLPLWKFKPITHIKDKFKPSRNVLLDSRAIVTLTSAGLIGVIESLKSSNSGKFFISIETKQEVANIRTLGGIKLLPYIGSGIINVLIAKNAQDIFDELNSTVYINGEPVQIISSADAEAIACCIQYDLGLVTDEKFLMSLRDPKKMKKDFELYFDDVKIKPTKLIKDLRMSRTLELIHVAFKKEVFKGYEYANINKIPNFDKVIEKAVIQELKNNGCPIY